MSSDYTQLDWFIFHTEPSFVLSYGPKYDPEKVFTQALSDFRKEARLHYRGTLSYESYAGWNDTDIPLKLHSFVLQGSIWKHEDESSASFIISLFPPGHNYSDNYYYFDNLRFSAQENDPAMSVIETVSDLIRYAANMKQWLVFAYAF